MLCLSEITPFFWPGYLMKSGGWRPRPSPVCRPAAAAPRCPEGDPVVGRDDEKGLVPEPQLHQPAPHLTEQAVGEAGLTPRHP